MRAFMFVCCLPYAYGEGGFAWLWGAWKQSCTEACSSVGLTCVVEFDKVGSQAALEAASDDSVDCSSYAPGSESGRTSYAPAKGNDGTSCYAAYWQSGSGGTCDATPYSDWPGGWFDARLCSCTCAAETYSTSDLKPYPCSR